MQAIKDKKKLGLIGAVVLTLVGTIALVAFVQSAEDRALADQEVVDVLVATTDIPAGTAVEDLGVVTEVKRIPVGAKSPSAAGSLSELSPGQVVAIDLTQNEQITGSRLALVDEFAKQGSIEIPEGMMEVTVSLGSEQTIGGTLTAGEKVALALTQEDRTGVVLHKMLVTHVQGAPVVSAAESTAVDSNERPPAPGGNLLVTFAVDIDQLQKVVYAAEHGSVWLAREPSAAPEISIDPQTGEDIYG